MVNNLLTFCLHIILSQYFFFKIIYKFKKKNDVNHYSNKSDIIYKTVLSLLVLFPEKNFFS